MYRGGEMLGQEIGRAGMSRDPPQDILGSGIILWFHQKN